MVKLLYTEAVEQAKLERWMKSLSFGKQLRILYNYVDYQTIEVAFSEAYEDLKLKKAGKVRK